MSLGVLTHFLSSVTEVCHLRSRGGSVIAAVFLITSNTVCMYIVYIVLNTSSGYVCVLTQPTMFLELQ